MPGVRQDTVDVCICTYRRDSLFGTLGSLAAQIGADPIRVIVADNAETPEAAERVARAAATMPLDVVYVHAPARNISTARNACLRAAAADWIAFIDDDETASPTWLVELMLEAERGGWDAVLGPVDAVYPPGAPAWTTTCDLHSTRPVWVNGAIATGYCGNALIRRAFIEAEGLRFDPALGRSGGEDADFLHRLNEAGGRIGYAPNALALEPAPAERLRFSWVLKRKFRAGQTYAEALARNAGAVVRGRDAAVALAKAAALSLTALLLWPSVARRNRLVARAALHAGVVMRLAGLAPMQLY